MINIIKKRFIYLHIDDTLLRQVYRYGRLRKTLGSNSLQDCLFDITLPTSDLSKITSNYAEVRNDRHVNRANIIRYHEIPGCHELQRRYWEQRKERKSERQRLAEKKRLESRLRS